MHLRWRRLGKTVDITDVWSKADVRSILSCVVLFSCQSKTRNLEISKNNVIIQVDAIFILF